MILTDKEIRSLCSANMKKPLISPFSEEALSSESYDISIGDEITVFSKNIRCIDIRNSDNVDGLYITKKLTEKGYMIYPKEYVLVSLKETISLNDKITAHIRPRTRFTRLGLIVSDQHCNSTYSGVLTVGIFNASDSAIKIYPDVRIAQIVFEELKSVPSDDKQYKNKPTAEYQNEKEFRGYRVPPELKNDVNEFLNSIFSEG